MIYNQDDEVDFLSDKKVEELRNQDNAPRRRGGAYQEEERLQKNVSLQKVEEEEESGIFNNIIIAVAIIVVIIAVIVLVMVFVNDSKQNKEEGTKVENNTSTTQNEPNTNNSNSTNSPSSNGLAITSVNDTYDAYSIDIESVVHVKGGNFYNNNEKIKGDKAYVEYKQISGLKDTKKQEEINEKLKSLSVDLYDKNYLSDENTLFIDIHTKLSVNFNTLSYVVIKTYEDIDGNRKDEKALSYNIRLDTLEEIDFEDLFTENANIKNIYKDYVKGNVDVFYFDPKYIYIYDEDLSEDEIKIDMSKNYTNIAIYNRYKDANNLFKSSPTSKKVFTVLNSTVSEETTDRAFEQN